MKTRRMERHKNTMKRAFYRHKHEVWCDTHCSVFKVVEAVVRQNEPPSLPGFHSASWQEEKEEQGSETKAAVTDWLSPIRKQSRAVKVIIGAGPTSFYLYDKTPHDLV